MSTTRKVATQWQQLGTTSDVDAEGRLTLSLHLVELESGQELTCSVTGAGLLDGGYFIAALQIAAAYINQAVGGGKLGGVKTINKVSHH